MAQITNIAATTETEAVNSMLAAIGEAPVSDIETTDQPDVVMALNILRESVREVLSEGWRFNTKFNLRLLPQGTVALDGETYNVFTPPAALLRFDAEGNIHLYPTDTFKVNAEAVLAFRDADNDRDGWLEPELLLKRAVFFLDWKWLPESARQYILKTAVNRFTEAVPGSPTLVSFTERDLMVTRRSLTRDQGIKDRYNIFRAADFNEYLGGRS